MDENGIFNPEISSKNYHLLFIKRALQLLLPVSLASFLFSYRTSTNFPILFASYFNCYFTTLVFPFLTHVLERKYMFLICNGILAFLVKTNNPNNSTSSVFDADDGFGNDSSLNIPPVSGQVDPTEPESSPQAEINNTISPDPGDEAEEEEEEHPSPEAEDAFADDEVVQGKSDVFAAAAEESDQGGDFIIESDEYLQMDMDDEDQEEEEMEELAGGGALGEQEMEVNMNTEELNKKFEAFIRKMKEDLRLQEQQQLIAV